MSDARSITREAFEHFTENRLDQAVACYRRAVEVDPSQPLAWTGLSKAYQRQGKFELAIEAAQKLTELEPDDPLSFTNLSILYQAKGMIPEAEDAKARALQLENQAR